MNRTNAGKAAAVALLFMLGIGSAQAQVVVHGSVFGAGKGSNSDVAIAQVHDSAIVEMSAGTVLNSIYGGGELSAVATGTRVTVSGGLVGVDDPASTKGFVFGGGKGTIYDPAFANVKGNAKVVISGGIVHNTVFGGGELATVGTFTTASGKQSEKFVDGEPYSFTEGTGRSLVIISGGQIGHKDATLKNDIGYVFGAGMGVYTDPHAAGGPEPDEDNARFGYVDSAEVQVTGGLVCGAVWGGSENGQVRNNCGVHVSGGQIGVGWDWTNKKGLDAYTSEQWTNAINAVKNGQASDINTHAGNMPECYHWTYGAVVGGKTHYLPYDPYDGDLYDVDDASANPGDGHTFFGNVFGGGSGYYPYIETHIDGGETTYTTKFYEFQGRVRGNTYVEITGGHILTSVYGGCEYADVLGDCNVTMTGGTIGVPRTVDSIRNHPVTCYLFGAGKGDQRTSFNHRTNVDNAIVNVGGEAMIFGSVFGGGEDGHVFNDTKVTIGGNAVVGTWGTSYLDGNIFGGGRGFGGTAIAAGSIGGNVEMDIKESCRILGSVYGGGRLASVGIDFDQNDLMADDAINTHGHIVINISGGTIGNSYEFNQPAFHHETTYAVGDVVYHQNSLWRFTKAHTGVWDIDDVTDVVHTTGGNVFGSSMGRLLNIGTDDDTDPANFNSLWPGLAKCKSTNIAISGTARIYSNVYGGGELGYVMGNATVAIDGANVEIGHAVGTGLDVAYFGSVYGGGYGSDNIVQHENDSAGFGTLSVTAAMHAGRVYGNTYVTLTNGHVMGNIYGGGELASVGRRWVHMANKYNPDEPYALLPPFRGKEGTTHQYSYTMGGNTYNHTSYGYDPHVGNTFVNIEGGIVGEVGNVTVGTHRYAGRTTGKIGGVFGGSKGRPGTAANGFHYTRMAYVDSATVTVSGTARIAASVFGGGENGHVRFGTHVVVNGGTIGLDHHLDEYDTDPYGYTPEVVYHGNVYGGGRGVDIDKHGAMGQAAGQVFGNTNVEIGGNAHVMHNVYGGGSIASVGYDDELASDEMPCGTAMVTVGGDAIVGDAYTKGLNSGRVFGSGRGMAGAEYATRAYTHNTYVTVEGNSHVYGSVFGSGENGHVEKHTHVYINGGQIGELWSDLNNANYKEFVGNVYGGGRGVDPHGGEISRTAGLVRGSTHITVSGGHVYHNIYGGGSLANVGDTTSEGVSGYATYKDSLVYDYTAAPLTEEGFDAATNNGHAYIYIKGGKIGVNGSSDGRVFGAGRGNAGKSNFIDFIDPISDEDFEADGTTNVTIDGTSYTVYYKTIRNAKDNADSVVSYRLTTQDAMGFIDTKPVWVLGKARTSTSEAYADSVVLRDYTNHTFINGSHVVINYPSVDSTTSYPADRTTLYDPMTNYTDALVATQTATDAIDFIRGCVFGGGDNGHVRGNTEVVVKQGRIGTLTSNGVGNVFGGGRGEGRSFDGNYSDAAGKVYGNTNVTVEGGWILHNVYGGGNLSSVGDFTVDLDGAPAGREHDKDAWLTGLGTVAGYTTSGGQCNVTIKGGTIGEKYSDIMDGANVRSGMDSRNSNLGGNVFGSSRGQSSNDTLINRMAYVNNTVVSIDGAAAKVNGSVFGGGENGHVFYTARVYMKDGHVGVPNTAASGDIYRGNVYGGGRGIDPVAGTNAISRNSGLILGNTYLTMTGGQVYHNVFGGGSMATVGTYTYKEGTGADKDHITALQRDETGKAEVLIKGGTVGIDGNNNGRVFGAGRGIAGLMNEQDMDEHTFVDRTYVTIDSAANITGCVFGSGDNGHVLHNTQVVVAGGQIGSGLGGPCNGNVFGSGRGADKYDSNDDGTPDAFSPSAGRVYGNTDVYIVGGTMLNDIYGGGYLATVDNNTHVTINTTATVEREGYTFTGGVPTPATINTTFSGYNGQAPIVWGDVFGGSALGAIGHDGGTTTLDILGGTIGSTGNYTGQLKGSIFGGGNGDGENALTGMDNAEANVLNTVQVNIGSTDQYGDNAKGATILGRVYGCNNVMGTPLADVNVDVYSTAHTATNAYSNLKTLAGDAAEVEQEDLEYIANLYEGGNDAEADDMFALTAVYGGGNRANYVPAADKKSTVTIHECEENTIKYVYGGGRAASSNETHVVIEGGLVYRAFAGGDGSEGVGANIGLMPDADGATPYANGSGNTDLLIEGGAIHQSFGGSNTLGMVRGTAQVNIEPSATCEIINNDIYGGGNMAPGGNTIVTIPCGTKGLTDVYGGSNEAPITGNVILNILGGEIVNAYGGSRNADVDGNVTVNVLGGSIENVFGGNNMGGNISGQITVNIDFDDDNPCTDPRKVDYVYGGGNMAAYAPTYASQLTPQVNIVKGFTDSESKKRTVDMAVFGGGYGSDADITANPYVIVGAPRQQKYDYATNTMATLGTPDDDIAATDGVTIGTDDEVAGLEGDVFGGGNAAAVKGNTTVVVRRPQTIVYNNVYGGGNAATVSGNTDVHIGYDAPVLQPLIGIDGSDKVTIASATSGATIHYTTDGSTPTAESATYTAPIAATSGQVVKAVAVSGDGELSPVAVAGKAAKPVLSADADWKVKATSSTPNAELRYTTDGSTPNASSTLYSGAVSLAAGQTIKVVAFHNGFEASAVAETSRP